MGFSHDGLVSNEEFVKRAGETFFFRMALLLDCNLQHKTIGENMEKTLANIIERQT